MKRIRAFGTYSLLAGWLLVSWCYHPTPSTALVEIAPGVVAEADQSIMKELVAAFDEAEVAVRQADIDALMLFYGKGYNYHGLKLSEVRRVWSEVFAHYGAVTSKHVFTELKLAKAGSMEKAYVTCTGGLYGLEKETRKPITIDSWVNEVHHLVKENGRWHFHGNAGGAPASAPPSSAPHHPLF